MDLTFKTCDIQTLGTSPPSPSGQRFRDGPGKNGGTESPGRGIPSAGLRSLRGSYLQSLCGRCGPGPGKKGRMHLFAKEQGKRRKRGFAGEMTDKRRLASHFFAGGKDLFSCMLGEILVLFMTWILFLNIQIESRREARESGQTGGRANDRYYGSSPLCRGTQQDYLS